VNILNITERLADVTALITKYDSISSTGIPLKREFRVLTEIGNTEWQTQTGGN